MSLKPSPQQDAIRQAAATGDAVTVIAAAGAGKTTVLRMIAEQAGRAKRGLYAAYNKAIADDANGTFPDSCRCSTVHSIAYRAVGGQFRHRMDRNAPHVSAAESARILKINQAIKIGDVTFQPNQIQRLARQAVTNYCRDGAYELSPWHVPMVNGLTGDYEKVAVRDAILPYAKRAWADMSSTGGRLRFDQSVYLKLWALSEPLLRYDYILLDEAQDANRVILRVMQGQLGHAQMIVVGDPNQAINCQPVGTMVEVPVSPAAAPAESRCGGPGCERKRDHKTSGLCHQHELQDRAGRPLEPIARVSGAVTTELVPIESLHEGDHVVTYDNSHVFKRGRPITHISRFPYTGPLISVSTATGLSSSYTPEHHCIVRIGHEFDGKHIVYLMRQADRFRIGRTPFLVKSQDNMFGLGMRATAENADAAWILSVHDTKAESALAECLAQHEFNIPGVRFESNTTGDVLDVKVFWEKHGSNLDRGKRCLEAHGRLIDRPLWDGGKTGLVGVRRPIVTAAANLLDGFLVLPAGNAVQYQGKRDYSAPASQWEPVRVTRSWYEGDIVSLEVADHHTYYGDGILTHNSWNGAVNALDLFQTSHRLTLSTSFRFGHAIADAANQWLEVLNAEYRVSGYGQVQSRLDTVTDPDAILCRTNTKCIEQTMAMLDEGRKVALAGKNTAGQLVSLAEAALELKEGRGTSHPALFAFQTWGQVQDYAADDPAAGDLRGFVDLIDKHGPDKIIASLSAVCDEATAEVIVSTVHKAKGREWDKVLIADDFKPPKDNEDGTPGAVEPERAMIGYVGVTRAKKVLDRGSLAWVDDYTPGAWSDATSGEDEAGAELAGAAA